MSRMETVPEEEFANLENVTSPTSTVEVVRHVVEEQPPLMRAEKFETVASCVEEPRMMHENLPSLYACCNCFDLRIGLSVWICFEAVLWFILTISGFVHGIMYIHAVDLFEFFDLMEDSWYSLLVFGDEIYFVDSRIRCELKKSMSV